MDSEWELEHPGGKFNVEFRADGFNHFVCNDFPAHSHWTMGGAAMDEVTISWGKYGTYVLKIAGDEAAGSSKGNPSDWRKMKKKRDLDEECEAYLPRQACHYSLPPDKVACHLHEELRRSGVVPYDTGPALSD